MDTLTDKMLNIYCTNTKEGPFVKTANPFLIALAGAAPVLLGMFGDYISYGVKRWLGDPNRWEAERIADTLNLPEPYKRAARSFAAAGINPLQALSSAGINPFNPELSQERDQEALRELRTNSMRNRLAAVEQMLPSSNTNPLSEIMGLMRMFEA